MLVGPGKTDTTGGEPTNEIMCSLNSEKNNVSKKAWNYMNQSKQKNQNVQKTVTRVYETYEKSKRCNVFEHGPYVQYELFIVNCLYTHVLSALYEVTFLHLRKQNNYLNLITLLICPRGVYKHPRPS